MRELLYEAVLAVVFIVATFGVTLLVLVLLS